METQVVGESELGAKAKAMFDAQKDPLAAPWERQWSETIKYWREKAATPQSSAPVVDWNRLLRLAKDATSYIGVMCHDDDEMNSLRNAVHEIESALTGRG